MAAGPLGQIPWTVVFPVQSIAVADAILAAERLVEFEDNPLTLLRKANLAV
jgi:hypothetical protein